MDKTVESSIDRRLKFLNRVRDFVQYVLSDSESVLSVHSFLNSNRQAHIPLSTTITDGHVTLNMTFNNTMQFSSVSSHEFLSRKHEFHVIQGNLIINWLDWIKFLDDVISDAKDQINKLGSVRLKEIVPVTTEGLYEHEEQIVTIAGLKCNIYEYNGSCKLQCKSFPDIEIKANNFRDAVNLMIDALRERLSSTQEQLAVLHNKINTVKG